MMAEVLGIQSQFSFADDFVDGKNGVSDPVMIAARIPRVQRASPAVQLSSSNYSDADYCLALRVWDVLLWFAIMRRPRRDVGICSDFAQTLAEYSVQLLPCSVFPYDVVPMTRVDAIQKSQVLLEAQYCSEKYGGHIFRQLTIPRHENKSINTSNFTLQCAGKVGTKVLEDEMYMSEIIMMADDMGMPWFEFPLD